MVSYDSLACLGPVSCAKIRPAPGKALDQWPVAGHILALDSTGRLWHTCRHWRQAVAHMHALAHGQCSSITWGASNHKPAMSWLPVVLDCSWPLVPVLVVPGAGTGACSLAPAAWCLGHSPTGLSSYWYLPSCALCSPSGWLMCSGAGIVGGL